MGALSIFIESLGVLSTTLELVPVIGPNLKAAAELASKICEQIEVRDRDVSDLRQNSNIAPRKSRTITKATSSSEFKSVDFSWLSPPPYRRPAWKTWTP
jgi:hypothetical protein